jgi:hypothetical protein
MGMMTGEDVLRQLIDPSWFDSGSGTARMRFYSVLLASESGLDQWGSGDATGFPVIAAIARVHELNYKSHVGAIVTRPHEAPRATVSRADRTLPDGLYLILSTPERDPRATQMLLDAYAGVMRLSHGNNIAHALVLEGTVDSTSGEMFMHLPTLNLPQPCDGPWLEPSDFDIVDETFDALARAHGALKNRAVLALRLLEQSARDLGDTKFFHFWTALEVLLDTHRTAVIATCLARAYERDRSFVANVLGFDKITRRRQRLFHEGVAHDIPQDVEAYLHALFQDLLREQLQLPTRRLMAQQLSRGFDIQRLDPEFGASKVGVFTFSGGPTD